MKLPFPAIDEVIVESGYQRCVAEYQRRGNTAGLRTLELERHGGKCHYCDKLFREVKVDNLYGHFSYFIPGCNCYKQCVTTELWDHPEILIDGCGRWMVEERFRNLTHCLRCYGDPEDKLRIITSVRKSKAKPARARIDVKARAAGEKE